MMEAMMTAAMSIFLQRHEAAERLEFEGAARQVKL
jgi:hypothetical protein